MRNSCTSFAGKNSARQVIINGTRARSSSATSNTNVNLSLAADGEKVISGAGVGQPLRPLALAVGRHFKGFINRTHAPFGSSGGGARKET